MTENASEREPESNRDEDTEEMRVIDADELFQEAREVCVVLAGIRYRLRITRRNKLILQK